LQIKKKMPCNSEDFPVPCDRCQEELPESKTLEGEKSTPPCVVPAYSVNFSK
jgi:hypothetical protein